MDLQLTDFNDIVFEDRNKAFGAYYLRKLYNKNSGISLLISIGFISVVLLASFFYINFTKATAPEDENVEVALQMVEINSIDPKAPEPPKLPKVYIEPPKIASIKFVPPVIKPDEEVPEDENVPEESQLKDAVIASKTQEGETGIDNATVGEGNEKSVVGEEDNNVYFGGVQETANFPGGEEALHEFFRKHMDVIQAKRKGVKGRVVLFFIIEKDGSISGEKMLKGMADCEACNTEAMRVLKEMPKWSAAKQNGRPVRLQKTLPILIDYSK